MEKKPNWTIFHLQICLECFPINKQDFCLVYLCKDPFQILTLRRNTVLKPSVARGEARVEAREASEDSGFPSTSRVEKWVTPVAQVWSRSIPLSRGIQKNPS
jgi:hypothetical protein